MKKCNLLVIFFIYVNVLCHAQGTNNWDALQFNQKASRLINRWAVNQLAATKSKKKYEYGLVYVQRGSGLAFIPLGEFTIGATGKFVDDTAMRIDPYKQPTPIVTLGRNNKTFAGLPQSHYDDLDIKGLPDWFNSDNNYADTLKRNVVFGSAINKAGDYELALAYLLPTYKNNPDYDSVAFELGRAYNGLGRYQDAIAVLGLAVKTDAADALLYNELGVAYRGNHEEEMWINSYTNGIRKDTSQEHLKIRAYMAQQIALYYQSNGRLYHKWVQKTKQLELAEKKFEETEPKPTIYTSDIYDPMNSLEIYLRPHK